MKRWNQWAKKTASLLTAVFFAGTVLFGCASNTEPSAASGAAVGEEMHTKPTESGNRETEKETQTMAEEPVNIRVAALKGPTAMGMVSFMEDADQNRIADEPYTFEIVASPDEMTPKIAKGEVDIAAVPGNLASILYNNMDKAISVLTINTLGVLYLLENGDTIHTAADLRGKTVYASGKGSTPEYALTYVLEQNGLTPGNDVTIEWKSEHTECVAAITADPSGVAMLPQPFVTTAQAKNDSLRVALDLTEEWEAVQDNGEESSMITGVTIIRTEFAKEHPDAVEDFLLHYQESVAYVNEHTKEAAALVGSYDIVPEEVAEKALPACNIVYIDGEEMKEKLSGYLSVLYEQNPESIGGALPDDGFYYTKQEN